MGNEVDYYLDWLMLTNPYGTTGNYWDNADDIIADYAKWRLRHKKKRKNQHDRK